MKPKKVKPVLGWAITFDDEICQPFIYAYRWEARQEYTQWKSYRYNVKIIRVRLAPITSSKR